MECYSYSILRYLRRCCWVTGLVSFIVSADHDLLLRTSTTQAQHHFSADRPLTVPNSDSWSSARPEHNTSSFHPLLPPAIPLAVRSPYLSAWLATGAEGGNGGYLSGRWAQFWPIGFPADNPSQFRLAWAGLIRVNGKTYQFMGEPLQDAHQTDQSIEFYEAVQISMNYTSTQSIFVFQAGSITFQARFLSPIGDQGDLFRQSLPFSYLSIEIVEQPDPSDRVQVYTDIQGDWASGDHDVNITWSLEQAGEVMSYLVKRQQALVFSEQWEYAEWGQAIYATYQTRGLTTTSGPSSEVRLQFIKLGHLNGYQDSSFRKINDQPVAFGYSIPLSKANKPNVVFTIGHIRDPYVSYIRKYEPSGLIGFEARSGYWKTRFQNPIDLIQFSVQDYPKALEISQKIDQRIVDDSKQIGNEDYLAIVSLSARQAMSAHEVTIGSTGEKSLNQSDVKVFMKEISSNGDMSTVDVIFPQFPALAYFDPSLMKYMLEPIFEYSESGMYPNKWTVHDLGRYPNATGHNDGNDEPMPVEEAGNILIMSLAYYQLSKDTPWISKHYRKLLQWTDFLVEDGLIPFTQLSTDDFAGKLANQTNLALKAIIGIKVMSELCQVVKGGKEKGERLRKISEDYVDKWMKFGLSQDKKHTKLAYQSDQSWGTLYNIFADRLLNLKLVPWKIYETQNDFYPTVANQFGVPLDSRHSWAKTDWQMFAAGAMTTIAGRDLFTSSLVRYLKANKVNAAFPDLYETDTAEYPGRANTSTWRIEFIDRPVVGGHFSLLALDRLNHINGVKEFPFRQKNGGGHVHGRNCIGVIIKTFKQDSNSSALQSSWLKNLWTLCERWYLTCISKASFS